MMRRGTVLRIALGIVVVGGAISLALHRDQLSQTTIQAALQSLGPWAPVAHVALYVVGAILFAPAVILTLAGGALFGPIWGTLLNLTGATLGATAAFLVARYVAADTVRRAAGPRLSRVIGGVEAEGWRFVAFARLVPLIPFNVLNYALGLSRIRLIEFILASVVCMIPATAAYSWLGYAGRAALMGDGSGFGYGLLALGLLACIAFVPRLLRNRRAPSPQWVEPAELAAQLARGGDVSVIDVRGPDEFIGPLGHIVGARNLPVDEVAVRLAELGALRDRPVVIVCLTDKRSARAAETLRGAGFRDVRVLHGGMRTWTETGLPVAATGPVADP